jgi:hypothetical protein
MNSKAGIIAGVLGLVLSGCFTPDPKSLTSDNPAASIPAIKDAATAQDRKAVPRLIVDLDDDDPAIRFAAITALQRITGQTLNYRYYDDSLQRQPAIQQWRAWLNQHPPQ